MFTVINEVEYGSSIRPKDMPITKSTGALSVKDYISPNNISLVLQWTVFQYW